MTTDHQKDERNSMPKLLVFGVIAVMLIGGMMLFNRTDSNAHKISKKAAAASLITANAIVYDVRTPDEYATSHAKDAINLPLQDIEKGTLPSVPKNSPIYVYCRSGNRSNQAVAILKKAGFSNVHDIGGLGNLKKYGLTTVKD